MDHDLLTLDGLGHVPADNGSGTGRRVSLGYNGTTLVRRRFRSWVTSSPALASNMRTAWITEYRQADPSQRPSFPLTDSGPPPVQK